MRRASFSNYARINKQYIVSSLGAHSGALVILLNNIEKRPLLGYDFLYCICIRMVGLLTQMNWRHC